tara:strand:- start:282 stop:425 length:144 start_codon:yes stop_codon:yes gene_type:complete
MFSAFKQTDKNNKKCRPKNEILKKKKKHDEKKPITFDPIRYSRGGLM